MMSGFKAPINGCTAFSTIIDDFDYNNIAKSAIQQIKFDIHPDRNTKCNYYAGIKFQSFESLLKAIEELKKINTGPIYKDDIVNYFNPEEDESDDSPDDSPDDIISQFMEPFSGNVSGNMGSFFGNFRRFGHPFFQTNPGSKQKPLHQSKPKNEKFLYNGREFNAKKVILTYGDGRREKQFTFTLDDGTIISRTYPIKKN
jgi:hypothetical protein